jgi:hypothetical protein
MMLLASWQSSCTVQECMRPCVKFHVCVGEIVRPYEIAVRLSSIQEDDSAGISSLLVETSQILFEIQFQEETKSKSTTNENDQSPGSGLDKAGRCAPSEDDEISPIDLTDPSTASRASRHTTEMRESRMSCCYIVP